MALEYNPSFVDIRTRSTIIDKHYEGMPVEQIASTINSYIRNYEKNCIVLSKYELKKNEKKSPIQRYKLLDDDCLKYNIQNH